MDFNNLLNNYCVEEILFNNGDESTHILNKFPIYVINLRSDVYRRNYIISLFEELKINFKLIVVNKLQNLDLNDKNLSKLGCILSHMWCLKNAISLEYKKFIIFEDDIVFHKKFKEYFSIHLNCDYDLLLLGASDFNFKKNLQYLDDTKKVYFPKFLVCGAHANLYKLDFAVIFYQYLLQQTVVSNFDSYFKLFYDKYKIAVCFSNLIICELTTTNIDHNYSYLYPCNNKIYLSYCFPKKFDLRKYNYIPIHFIMFANNKINIYEFNKLFDMYIKDINIEPKYIKSLIEIFKYGKNYIINKTKTILSKNETDKFI
jgi:GR25 family glycosyltransferase involved in LPS biosynthesis